MKGGDFIDTVMVHAEEVPATDSNYATLRLRYLLLTQWALQRIWDADDWDFKLVIGGTVTLLSGQYKIVTPSDFFQMGHQGSLWWQSNAYELVKREPWEVNQLRRSAPSQTGRPSIFAIAGQNGSDYRPEFIFDIVADQNYTFEFDYERICPTITDDASAGNGLMAFPAEHVESVLLPCVLELKGSLSGDGRVPTELGPRARAAIDRMKAHRDQNRPDLGRLGDYGLRRFGMH